MLGNLSSFSWFGRKSIYEEKGVELVGVRKYRVVCFRLRSGDFISLGLGNYYLSFKIYFRIFYFFLVGVDIVV